MSRRALWIHDGMADAAVEQVMRWVVGEGAELKLLELIAHAVGCMDKCRLSSWLVAPSAS